MVNRALKAIRRSDVVLLVIDVVAGITDQDKILAQRVAEDGRYEFCCPRRQEPMRGGVGGGQVEFAGRRERGIRRRLAVADYHVSEERKHAFPPCIPDPCPLCAFCPLSVRV